MSEQKSSEWKRVLGEAVQRAKAQVMGWDKIERPSHAVLIITALRAFGDDPRAVFFMEVLASAGNIPRPDLILLHPDIGVLVIENKGVSLDHVQGVDGTSLNLLRNGQPKREDPFYQAEKVSFRLRDLAAHRVDVSEILFLRTAALPRISRKAFTERFGVQWPHETLFSEQFADPSAFRAFVLGYSEYTNRNARRSSKLSLRASNVLMTILNGRGFLHTSRRSYVDEPNPNLLGMKIQEMELALKEATPQQRELGSADLRGHHRLFRGVAGSGKSIMLALSVAQTLGRYDVEGGGLFDGGAARKRVLVVCFNRTLVQYLTQKIDDRYGRLTWNKASDQALRVMHFEGLVRSLEEQVPALKSGLSYEQKQQRAKFLCEAFDKLDETVRNNLGYDAVYIDEAQDLLPEEIQFLLRLARKQQQGGSQTFVVFYDNAQNIYGVPQPVWERLGVNIVGRTVFLDQCLRNTREVLTLAFNVLVGSFSTAGEKVTTKAFSDVASLRERGLVEEKDDRFEIHFSPRTGAFPMVRSYASRREEIAGTIAEVRRLIHQEKVLPSDILILYRSHYSYGDTLLKQLEGVVGDDHCVRAVNRDNNRNKGLPLLEDGVLTVSTVASAKGYDAPVVFLLGADEFPLDTQGRATFYVGATRAKLQLVVSGVKGPMRTLLDEVVLAAKALNPNHEPIEPAATPKPEMVAGQKKCKHCGGLRLHAQHGKFGYFYRCIDCAENTAIDMRCERCGKKARVRKAKEDFFLECDGCRTSQLIHRNVPLSTLNGKPF